jgi:hypothetical protein
MKDATTPEEMRRWVQQWRQTGILLDEVKRRELAEMTEEQARQAARLVLSIPRRGRDPNVVSGLVEQQAIFHRRRVK